MSQTFFPPQGWRVGKRGWLKKEPSLEIVSFRKCSKTISHSLPWRELSMLNSERWNMYGCYNICKIENEKVNSFIMFYNVSLSIKISWILRFALSQNSQFSMTFALSCFPLRGRGSKGEGWIVEILYHSLSMVNYIM